MGRTRSAVDGGAADGDASPAKRQKKTDKGDKGKAQQEALDDAQEEAGMLPEEEASEDASSNKKIRTAGADRLELLDSRKKLDESRNEAEELRRKLKQLEEQKTKELVEANSGKTLEKTTEKLVTRIFSDSILSMARY